MSNQAQTTNPPPRASRPLRADARDTLSLGRTRRRPVCLIRKTMWPLPDKNASLRRPKSLRAKEFERRYREHLEGLPPERIKLMESDEFPVGSNAELMRDLINTVADFKNEMRENPTIEEVRPGVATEYACISVFLKPGADVQRSGLLEFYRGYWVRAHPRAVQTQS